MIPRVKALNSGTGVDGCRRNWPLIARFADSIDTPGNNSPPDDFLLLNNQPKGRDRLHPHRQTILRNTGPELLLMALFKDKPPRCVRRADPAAPRVCSAGAGTCRRPSADYCSALVLTIATARRGEQPLLTPLSIGPIKAGAPVANSR